VKLLPAAVSILVLLVHLALARPDPAWGLFYPRGGMAMLGVSLVIANSIIRAGAQPHRSPSMRFQLAAAGWIWLVAQGAGLAYLYPQTGAT